jgi:cell division septum initiation protein DivIVA
MTYHPSHGRRAVTPGDVAGQLFQLTSRLGGRGYDTAEVRGYLAFLADELRQRDDALAVRDKEIRRLIEWYRNQGVDPATQTVRAVSSEALAIITAAQRQAEEALMAARMQAATEITDAQLLARAMIEQARAEADQAAVRYRQNAGNNYDSAAESALRTRAMLDVILRNLEALQASAGSIAAVVRHDMGRLAPASTEGSARVPERPPPENNTGHSRQ